MISGKLVFAELGAGSSAVWRISLPGSSMWSENTSILSTPYLLRVLREDPSEPDQFLGPSGPLNCLFSDCKKLDTYNYHEFTFS